MVVMITLALSTAFCDMAFFSFDSIEVDLDDAADILLQGQLQRHGIILL